jgi:hypothetical protein
MGRQLPRSLTPLAPIIRPDAPEPGRRKQDEPRYDFVGQAALIADAASGCL